MFKALCNSCDGKYDSLDVRITKACDNDCPFCIEKSGIEDQGMESPAVLAESTIKTGIKDVLILGGEPFLIPSRVLQYINGIREYADTIYATTSLPESIDTPVAYEAIKMLDGLNVSLQSIDWQENNSILRSASKHDRIALLKKLNVDFTDKIRVCLNLTKGGIDSAAKIIQALAFLDHIGCKNVKINELQHEPESYVSFESLIPYAKLKSPYAHGCQTTLTRANIKWLSPNMNILLKRSCFLVEPSRKASLSDLMKVIYKRFITHHNRFAVLYEDGKVRNGWITRTKGTSI